MRAALAGGLYFLAAFALGFVLGAIRVLAVTPRLGELGAVLLELPFMLAASWALSAAITRRLAIPPSLPPRLAMGLIGFALLMTGETLLGLYGFGQDLDRQLAHFATMAGAIGLAGQAAFALIPLLQGVRRRGG